MKSKKQAKMPVSKKKLKQKVKQSSSKSMVSSVSSHKKISSLKNKDLPVSQGQFQEHRNEMSSRFTSMELEFKVVRKEVDARFNQVDARFNQVDARFNKIEAQMSSLLAAIHQVRMVVEEQNNRNKFVLDGFANLLASQEAYRNETNEKFKQLESLLKISNELS
jgi:hypothetical protein